MVDVLPGIKPVKLIVPEDPAQTAADCDTVLNDGAGFTVSTTFSPGELLQPFALVVTWNVTFTGEDVVLVNVSFMFPDPLFAGWLIPATAALLHVNDEPGIELLGI